MSPHVAYAAKLVGAAIVAAGMLGDSIARMVVFGLTLDAAIPAGAGGIGLLVIALRLWRDEKFARRQEEFYEARSRFEYARGVADGRDGKTSVAEAVRQVRAPNGEAEPE